MRKQRPDSIGGYWLSKRPNSPAWYRTWFDPNTRQTRRASLGTDDVEQARIRLAEWVTLRGRMRDESPADVGLGDIFLRYFDQHGQHVIGADQQRRSLAMILTHVPEGMTAGELTLHEQEAAARRMREAGYAPGTIKRCFGAARAAITWAWKNGELEKPIPFIRLPEGAPRERALSLAELARLWAAMEPAHLGMFFSVALGTACRPRAALELTREQCCITRRLIDLNPPGRIQTAKRRPTVPLPDFLLPLIESVESGPLVNIGGRPVKKIAKAWRTAREAAGLDRAVVPYSLRHTVASELRARGVPEWEVAGLLGHDSGAFRMTGRYAKFRPDYLGAARAAIDDLAKEIGRLSGRPMSVSC